jgi:hypothetical protein
MPQSLVSEHIIWTLRHGGRHAEARVRPTPSGPELRIFLWTTDERPEIDEPTYALVFSEQHGGSRALGAHADTQLQEFLARGWQLDVLAIAAHLEATTTGAPPS